MLIRNIPDTTKKLEILSYDSRYDLACACATRDDEHRRRSKDDMWVYPVSLPNGGHTFLFKTLLSNECVNNCKYCPLRSGSGVRRCSLSPEELARTFLSYWRSGRVSGLFLTSGVSDKADATMERINNTALILRKKQFKGYIHLKVIPGASEAAIRQSMKLATAISLNIEVPGEENFKRLSTSKDYRRDIIRPLKFIRRLREECPPHQRVNQTTQFVVGASDETDEALIRASWKLYKEFRLNRVYFSAYQRGAGTADLPGEHSAASNKDLLMREHRLYQTDWLIRKYGFRADEIPFGPGGKLSLTLDPKEAWAKVHPEFFPVNVNRADTYQLLRVPGLGIVTVERILEFRRTGSRIRSLDDLGKQTKLLQKARGYITFS
ncbi:MAG: helix-hairpin-helix domain-containing protein [Candidatus Omnitrophica bacterium]|nr:helix-hairpin-helix domain-containing protein [Candidatus Omnitrophota bacterium]